MSEVSRGRLRVPRFQRGLQWKRKDVRLLLDSIYRGYPVGTLLFWQRAAEADSLQLGNLFIRAPARSDALWVVDGQQRITSLARVLLPRQPDGDEFALYFDLDQHQLVWPPRTQADRERAQIPLTEVLDSERLLSWLFEHRLDEKQRTAAINLGKRVREYQIPAYLVETENEQILREIFGRVNSAGKPLGRDAVFDALHGGRSAVHPANLTEIADVLEELGFGRLENDLLYRVLLAVQGEDVAGRRRPSPSAELEPGAYADTYRAAEAAIRFLQRDVEIPHLSLLPYKLPVITLGRFFHLHPEPQSRSRDLLGRWVWRGAWTGRHQGATVSTRKTLALIGDDEEAAVQGLLKSVGSKAPQLPTGPFNFRHATAKLQALALLDLRPVDLATGRPLEVQETLTGPKAWRQLFPAQTPAPSDLLRSVANRFFYPQPAGRLRRLLMATTDRRALASHAVDEKAHAALLRGDTGAFLLKRLGTLLLHFEAFLGRKARWEESDRPSLAALVVGDEEDP